MRKKFAIKKSYKGNSYKNFPSALGITGVLGFAGFFGFWTYNRQRTLFPFIFFIFFGFFGFYFEGKKSNVAEDELYKENERKAELKAYKIGIKLLFIVLWSAGMVGQINIEWCVIFMLVSISLIYALILFLRSFLLWYYENKK